MSENAAPAATGDTIAVDRDVFRMSFTPERINAIVARAHRDRAQVAYHMVCASGRALVHPFRRLSASLQGQGQAHTQPKLARS